MNKIPIQNYLHSGCFDSLLCAAERGEIWELIGLGSHRDTSWTESAAELQQTTLVSVLFIFLIILAWFSLKGKKNDSEIGSYTLQSKVGEGEITELYLAVNKRGPKQIVLIKKIKTALANNRNTVVRFEREAEVLSSLNHSNLVRKIEYNTRGHALVMEYVQGRNLAHLIKNYGKLPVEIVLYIAVQLCAGISHMHANNLVHCDIKPGNILLSHAGEVKLCDFGITRVLNSLSGRDEPKSKPVKGRLCGTLAYTSPEQILNNGVGFYSDIYSFGIVCYEMLTGEMLHVFGGHLSTADSMHCLVNETIPAVAAIRKEVPDNLNNLVMRCLRKDPEQRFQNTGDLLSVLQSMQNKSTAITSQLQLAALVK